MRWLNIVPRVSAVCKVWPQKELAKPKSSEVDAGKVFALTAFADDPTADFCKNNYGTGYSSYRDRGVASWYDAWRTIHFTSKFVNYASGRRIQADRHEVGSNALYIDGHVKLLTEDTLYEKDSWNDWTPPF